MTGLISSGLLQVLEDTSCTMGGNTYVIPGELTGVIRTIVSLIKIAVPILLIVWGMLDLAKAVIGSKEDEIKNAQKTFIKRLIAAAIVFFVVAIVQLMVNLLSGLGGSTSDTGTAWKCVCPFVSSSCK